MAIPDRLPVLQWGPKKLRAWAGQLVDVEDARQVMASPDDTSVRITEGALGREIKVAWPANNGGGGGAATAIKVGFGWYPSPTATGPNAGLKIRIRRGAVNDNVPVANNDAEFTLLPNVENLVRLTTYQQSDGIVTHSTLDIVSSIPNDPTGEIDIAPATSSRKLWSLVTDATSVIDDVAFRVGGIDVVPLEYGRTCEGALMRMFWGPGGAD